MSPNERDENRRPAEQDATEPAEGEPTIGPDAPEAPAELEKSDVDERAPGEQPPAERKLGRTLASGLWAGLIVAAIVLIFLLVFILQNLESVEIHFLMFTGSVPIGVALLLAAIAGILVVAVPGVARMIQLRRHSKR